MRLSPSLETEIWREVSRHLEIGESVTSLFPRLAAELGATWCVVHSWDDGRAELDVVGAAGAVPREFSHRIGLPTPRAAELRSWAAVGNVVRWMSRGETSLSRLLVPEPLDGPALAVPLNAEADLGGIFVLGGDVSPTAARALREPFEVALANDRRLHELARLTEAAEADRRALLQRLDRQDISETVVGADAGLRTVMERVDQVARTNAPVLLLGETGSGKEVVAREIHGRSPRARGPFLRVNCGAIPTELVDSELFGHERGAFTGAVATRKGWFERADGGTLFLDEIGELPAAAQVRLLRVLQDGTVQRVGGQDVHNVDVRILAATHRDLTRMVTDGGFRQDLWYRISVFPITLPPLRDRLQDIPPLARYFSERAGLRLHGVALAPTREEVDLLLAYPWPGNVRELMSVIERAAILGSGEGLEVRQALGAGPEVTPAPAMGRDDDAMLVEILRRCRGRIEGPFGAAAAIGVNPATLRSRLRKLGIDWSDYRG